MAIKDAINAGEMNDLGTAFRQAQVGEILSAGGVRLQRETLAVATAAATPKYTVLQLVYAKTIGTGAPAVKSPLINGAAPAAGQAAPNAGGTSIVFNAETTGTGTCDVVYLTADPPKDADGNAALALTAAGKAIG